jgi:hypothetical protein
MNMIPTLKPWKGLLFHLFHEHENDFMWLVMKTIKKFYMNPIPANNFKILTILRGVLRC